MDKNKKQTAPARIIIRASMWPVKRLAFKISKRGFLVHDNTSLLISNCLGVWSVRRRQYVRKRRFLRFTLLRAEALPMERQYASLRRLGMNDEQVASLRSRLVDTYWDAAPAWYKANVVTYFRAVRRWQMREWWIQRLVIVPCNIVTLALTSFLLVNKAFLGDRVDLLIFVASCILQVVFLCLMLFKFELDASVLRMLEILDKGYVKEIIE